MARLAARGRGRRTINEINMVPFIDVMLVLLIIFIITVPVIRHAVNLDLPQASNQRLLDKPDNVRLSVDAHGAYFWNGSPVDDAALAQHLSAAAAQNPQPQLHISADKAVRYERVAQAMAAAQRVGVREIGFVTEPLAP